MGYNSLLCVKYFMFLWFREFINLRPDIKQNDYSTIVEAGILYCFVVALFIDGSKVKECPLADVWIITEKQ